MSTPPLYFARLYVIPQPHHPLFWKIDSALLELFFFAAEDSAAEELVLAFARVAGWEKNAIERLGHLPAGAPTTTNKRQSAIDRARETGLGFWLAAVVTVGDESTHPA